MMADKAKQVPRPKGVARRPASTTMDATNVEQANEQSTIKRHDEQFFQRQLEFHLNGTHKNIPLVGITDISTDAFHVEVKNWTRWKEVIGQLLCYNQFQPRPELRAYFFGKLPSKAQQAVIVECFTASFKAVANIVVYHISLVGDDTLSVCNITNNANVMLGINHDLVPEEQPALSDIQKQEIDCLLESGYTTGPGGDQYSRQKTLVVDAGMAARWLMLTKGNFMRALRRSEFKEGKDYHETVEEVAAHETRPRRRPIHNVMMTMECFKGVCAMMTIPKSKEVLEYFTASEETQLRYKHT
jgi:hypothetical protein